MNTPYIFLASLALLIFCLAHLIAEKLHQLNPKLHKKILSIGGGISIAYVFIDLLPKLAKSDELVRKSLASLIPFLEKHVYIMALVGFLLFFSVDRTKKLIRNQVAYFWLSLTSYTLFNFFLGYAIVDQNNPEVRPLLLFSIAMTLHLLMNDYGLTTEHGEIYQHFGKWVLIGALVLGGIVGFLTEISQTGVALVSGFLGGGVIMNVIRHELPEKSRGSLLLFVAAACFYAAIILQTGH